MGRVKHISDSWSQTDLIAEVKKYPILFDKTLKEYRKASLTEQAWDEIAANINASGKFFKVLEKNVQQFFFS